LILNSCKLNIYIMKKAFVTFVVMLFVGLASTFAQSTNDSITVIKNKLYYQGKEVTSVSALRTIVANDDLALKQVKSANVASVFASVFAYIGGFAMGWEIGSLFFGKFNPYVFGGGVAVLGLGFGLTAVTISKMKSGAAIYNSHLGSTAYGTPVDLNFGLTPGGIGFTLSF